MSGRTKKPYRNKKEAGRNSRGFTRRSRCRGKPDVFCFRRPRAKRSRSIRLRGAWNCVPMLSKEIPEAVGNRSREPEQLGKPGAIKKYRLQSSSPEETRNQRP